MQPMSSDATSEEIEFFAIRRLCLAFSISEESVNEVKFGSRSTLPLANHFARYDAFSASERCVALSVPVEGHLTLVSFEFNAHLASDDASRRPASFLPFAFWKTLVWVGKLFQGVLLSLSNPVCRNF